MSRGTVLTLLAAKMVAAFIPEARASPPTPRGNRGEQEEMEEEEEALFGKTNNYDKTPTRSWGPPGALLTIILIGFLEVSGLRLTAKLS